MPKKRLTEEGVAKLKPPPAGKQIDYFDAAMPGLVLRVNYGGRKVWRALYYVKRTDANGNKLTLPTTHKLGRYPHLKLKQAREAAGKFLADPHKALAQGDAGTFRDVAEKFIKRYVDGDKDRKVPLRSKPEIERCLAKYIYPAWQERPFGEIRRSDVATLLDTIQDDHGARQADMVLAIVRKIMRWYATRNDDYECPVVPGMQRGSNGNGGEKRFLDDAEIRALWKACDDVGTFGALLKVALLCGQRREKVTTMKWSDIAPDGTWTIPTEPREKANARRLRLPQLALDIIAAQPRIAGNPYVFAGRGSGPFNSFSQRKAELDAKLPDMKPWVVHDLRRTFRKLETRAGVRADVAELALGHSIKGIQAVYDDRHEYAPMIDDALQRVAGEIDKIINPPPPNVVQIRPRASAD